MRGREPIPLLEQVLADLPDTRITIELKSAAVVPPMLAVLEKLDAWNRVCIGGFNESWLAAARAGGGDRLCTSMAYDLGARAAQPRMARPAARRRSRGCRRCRSAATSRSCRTATAP